MTKRTWIILAVVGGSLSLCCLGTGALMLLGATTGEGDPAPASASTGGGGSGLEGTWMAGSVGLTTYRSVATGELAPPSGTGELLELKPGGDCSRAIVLQSTVYSCTSYIFSASDECEWRFDGTTLSLDIASGTNRTKMCGGEVKESAAKSQALRYRVQVAKDADTGLEWLTLTDTDGTELRLRRER
jgi:hypothetical protein